MRKAVARVAEHLSSFKLTRPDTGMRFFRVVEFFSELG